MKLPGYLFLALFFQTARIEQDGAQRCAVLNEAFVDHFHDFRQLYEAKIDVFILFRMRIARHETLGQEHFHRFAEETRASVVLDQRLPLLGAVAGLLFQLALGPGEGFFARIELAGGQLPEELLRGMAILVLHNDPRILLAFGLVDGQDDYAAVVPYHVSFAGFATRFEEFVVEDAEQRTLIDDLGADEDFGVGGYGPGGFLFWFGFSGFGLFEFGGLGWLGLLRHAQWISLMQSREVYAAGAGTEGPR